MNCHRTLCATLKAIQTCTDYCHSTTRTNAVSPRLSTLASPRASGFADTTAPDDLTGPAYTVRLHDGTTRTLHLCPRPRLR